MATLEEKILEARDKQNRQFMEEMAKWVRVTLLEPYMDWRTGTDVVTMRFGSTAAKVVGEDVQGEDNEVIDLTRRQANIIPGRPIHYHLSWDEKTDMRCMGEFGCQNEPFDINRTITMPLPAAENWFGRWLRFNKVYAPGENPDPYDSIQHQRKLVAAKWGDYKLRQFDARYDAPKSWRKLEKIGAPAVPKVEIVRLDSQLRAIPNSTFRPWEVYKFEDELTADRWSEQPGDKIMAFTESQLKEFIAQAVAAERGNNMPNKGGRPRKVSAA
jgi:hypothetical protein